VKVKGLGCDSKRSRLNNLGHMNKTFVAYILDSQILLAHKRVTFFSYFSVFVQ